MLFGSLAAEWTLNMVVDSSNPWCAAQINSQVGLTREATATRR